MFKLILLLVVLAAIVGVTLIVASGLRSAVSSVSDMLRRK